MAKMLQQFLRWCQRVSSLQSAVPVRYGLQLAADNTLLNPARPYESVSPEALKSICDSSGREPLTRTMVHASLDGNSVQIFLLRDCGQLNV
jgi:hypothetical protein